MKKDKPDMQWRLGFWMLGTYGTVFGIPALALFGLGRLFGVL